MSRMKFDIKLVFIALILVSGVLAGAGHLNRKKQITRGLNGTRFLSAVQVFADQMIRKGRDVYGPEQTPLFVDGFNVDTGEPVKWKLKGGEEWVLINVASQQNFFRALHGLSNVTGEEKYKKAASEATRYTLDNLSFGQLIAWGGHIAYNGSGDSIVFAPDKGRNHELKSFYPYYELMWEVDPARTKAMLENVWNSHIMNWSNLDFNRHGAPKAMGDLWESKYEKGDVFFWGDGLTFKAAGSDLYYAAAMLSKLSGEDVPLVWAKRLAERYVETRHPNTGIGGWQFSQMAKAVCDPVRKIRGDRAQYQYGDDFPGHRVFEGTLFPCYGNLPQYKPEMCNFYIGEMLSGKADEFSRWATEEALAWARSAYRKEDNSFIPMLTDGTSMEGYVVKKPGYFGPPGRVLTAGRGDAGTLWIYARAYEVSGDQMLWDVARNIALHNGFGDIGKTPTDKPQLKSSKSSDYEALFAFLCLFEKTGNRQYLEVAENIGDNIINEKFVNNYFVRSKDHQFASIDAVEPLALLHLVAALNSNRALSVPGYPGGSGFFSSAYDTLGNQYDTKFIYTRKKKPVH